MMTMTTQSNNISSQTNQTPATALDASLDLLLYTSIRHTTLEELCMY